MLKAEKYKVKKIITENLSGRQHGEHCGHLVIRMLPHHLSFQSHMCGELQKPYYNNHATQKGSITETSLELLKEAM